MSIEVPVNTAGRRDPARIARWLLIAFAAGVLAFMSVAAWHVWDADDLSDVALCFVIVPYIVAPAAVAAWLARRAKSRTEAWSFVGAELAAVASTAGLWAVLVLVRPDPKNGLAMMVFPLVQFAALQVYALGVFVVASLARRKARPRAG